MEDFGRWCAFGVYLKIHGRDGHLDIRTPGLPLQELLRLPTFEMVVNVLRSFPHCRVTPVTNTPVTIHVEWENWKRYQGDYSGDRVRHWRGTHAHRRNADVTPIEEKRRDEKLESSVVGKRSQKQEISGKPDVSSLRTQAQEILDYLNKRSGRAFRAVDTNIGIIVARLKEGVTVDQCRAVIGLRAAKWKGDPKMDEYLRPLTIFRPSNFHQYMGDLPLPSPDPEAPSP